MNNPNKKLRYLTAYRQQLREELNQMNYPGAQVDMPEPNATKRDRSPSGLIIGVALLLMVSLFLVAFASSPESLQASDSETAVSQPIAPTKDILMVMQAPTLIPDYTLFSFAESEPNWNIVNDNVMGGRSQSSVEVDSGLERITFSGNVSLENNGGFASARSDWTNYNLAAYDGITIRVLGDGNIYRFRVRTEKTGAGLAYTAWFKTKADIWQEIYIPFTEMIPLYRGVVMPLAGPIDPASIRSFGLMISDKQQDVFSLEVDWINAVSENRTLDIVTTNLPTLQ